MATLNEAPEQLQAWIDEIDAKVGELQLQRRAMAATLAALGSPIQLDLPEPVVAAGKPEPEVTVDGVRQPTKPKVTKPLRDVNPDEAIEKRRQADRDRKKAERERKRDGKPVAERAKPGQSKYDYDEVAELANAAAAAGGSQTEALMNRYNVTKGMAYMLISAARKQGHEITSTKPAPKASNVTTHPAAGPRAFTPDDTLRIIEGG